MHFVPRFSRENKIRASMASVALAGALAINSISDYKVPENYFQEPVTDYGNHLVIDFELRNTMPMSWHVKIEDEQNAGTNNVYTEPRSEQPSSSFSSHLPPDYSKHIVTSIVVPSHVTAYYCLFNGGYLGDGGGYCNNFANGQQPGAELSGKVAACGHALEFGTKILIPYFGWVTCVDRGLLGPFDVDVFYWSSLAAEVSGIYGVEPTNILLIK